MEKCAVVIVRLASGGVEYHYEAALPKVGDRHGREGESGFVTRVELNGPDEATVIVGTSAPEFVGWDDLGAAARRAPRRSRSRERILEAAYELFSTRGIRAVGTEEILTTAGVSRSTLYRHFRTKQDLVLAFLQRREQRWTREFVEAEALGEARLPGISCSRSSTSSTSGSTATTSRAARSSTSCSRSPIWTIRSERRAPRTSRTSARSSAGWPSRRESTMRIRSASRGTC